MVPDRSNAVKVFSICEGVRKGIRTLRKKLYRTSSQDPVISGNSVMVRDLQKPDPILSKISQGSPMKQMIKIFLTLFYFVICVYTPLVGIVLTTIDELRTGPITPIARDTAIFWIGLFVLAVGLSGISSMWTLWGDPPRFIRLYTYCWSLLLPVFAFPIFLLVMADGHGGPLTKTAIIFMVPITLGLFGATFLGTVPAVILNITVPPLRS